MTKYNSRFGRLSAAVLAVSVLTGAVGASAAQVAPRAGEPVSYAQAVQGRDAHLAAERFQDAGLYDCNGTDIHTHLQRQACR